MGWDEGNKERVCVCVGGGGVTPHKVSVSGSTPPPWRSDTDNVLAQHSGEKRSLKSCQ